MTTTTADTTLDALLESRHSCRAFRSDPVPREVVEEVLALAQRTPSWCNTQPWQVHVTSGAATERLRSGVRDFVAGGGFAPDLPFPQEYVGVHRERRRECAGRLYESLGIAPDDRAASAAQTFRNFDLFDAPHVAVVTTDEVLGVYGVLDVGLWVHGFLLAATSRGIATVPQAALAGCAPFLREHLAIPAGRQVICAVSFGYADEEHPANSFRTTRAAPEDVVTWLES